MVDLLGAFTRPWGMLDYEEALAHLARVFRLGGLMRNKKKLPISHESSREQAQAAVEAARRHGVEIVCFLASAPAIAQSAEAGAEQFKHCVDLAAAAGIPHVLTTGVNDGALRGAYAKALQIAAPYAAEKGVVIGLKPHGGVTRTGLECRRFAEEVGLAGFGLWFDPGNFVFYDRLDPAEEVKPMAEYCVGVCLKDCAIKPDGKPDVMIQPGTGRVDFPACLRALKDAEFRGPMLFECLGGAEPEEIDANARRARSWIESTLAAL